MSAKIIAIVVAVLLIILAVGGYADYKLSYAAGSKSRDAICTTERAADKSNYESAQTDAIARAASAQKDADAVELKNTKAMLATAQQQALDAQSKADDAKALSANLSSNLTRLKNENKDVSTWSDACLPSALLGSLHPKGIGQAAASSCR